MKSENLEPVKQNALEPQTPTKREASLATEVKKECTKCLVSKPIADFYSKGKRYSSCCKKCDRESKKAKYVAKRDKLDVSILKRMFDIVYCHQIQSIQNEIDKLDEVINNARHK